MLLFTAEEMRWSVLRRGAGWDSIITRVYGDGRWEKETRVFPRPDETSSGTLSPDALRQLRSLLEGFPEYCDFCFDGCDGERWRMAVHAPDGSERYTFEGNVYGAPLLNAIIALLP